MALVEAGADINISSTEMMTPSLMTASRGFMSVLTYLVDHGADVHAVDQNQCTVLHHIVTKPNANLFLQEFILAGLQIDLQNKFGETPLYLATISNNEYAVNMILETNDSCVDLADRNGITPLMLAAIKNEIKIIKLLHKHSASINKQDSRGRTSLIFAIRNGNKSAIDVLLKTDACDVNLSDNKGKSPLKLAVQNSNTELIELLHQYGADITKQDNRGRTSLYPAAQNDDLYDGDVLLKTYGADINQKDKRGRTSLYLAVEKNNLKTVDVLLKMYGCDVNLSDDKEQSPLMLAVQNSNTELIGLLHQHGADINKQDACDVNLSDNQGKSPLMLAVQRGNTELMALLHQYGADINQQDNCGRTSLYLAVESNTFNAVDVLLKMDGCDVNLPDNKGKSPLMLAVQNSNTELIELLYQYGADINKQDGRGRSAVYYCLYQMCRRGEYSIEIMKLLECFGAEFRSQNCDNKLLKHLLKTSYDYLKHLMDSNKVDFDGSDGNGDNILHYLARCDIASPSLESLSYSEMLINGSVSSFRKDFLTDKRIDINRKNSTGNTPLMVAALLDNTVYMQILLQHGCSTNISNMYGHTVLHLSIIGFVKCKYYNTSQVDSVLLAAILSSDIDVNAQDKDGQTALMLAAKLGGYNIVKQLYRAGADCKILDKFGKSMAHYLDFAVTTDVNFCKYIIRGCGVDITDRRGKTMMDVAILLINMEQLSDALNLIRYLIDANYCFQNLGYNRRTWMFLFPLWDLLSGRINDHRKLLYESGVTRIDIASILPFMEDGYRYKDNNDVQTTRPVSKESEYHSFCNNICLKSLCRRIIRQYLGPNIQDKVTQLKVPLTVQNFLLLKCSLEDTYFILETEDKYDDDHYYCNMNMQYDTDEFCIDLYDSEDYYDYQDCDACTLLAPYVPSIYLLSSSISSSPSSPPSSQCSPTASLSSSPSSQCFSISSLSSSLSSSPSSPPPPSSQCSPTASLSSSPSPSSPPPPSSQCSTTAALSSPSSPPPTSSQCSPTASLSSLPSSQCSSLAS
ncbi:serine/threonine-protein phosphatase 6 regulatory ankyrin repeat subunit C-like [Patella vulgata]|uniref:serine/threonine-protein phosphatase 6 regulatory ankyrin repeat subunit C-like n=1 Tax=Patella vulgata TaxID=6465 RepID=UPI0021809B26|nr:serine/threonine-protein phosphatase 6 regulatory ankyrin repeat subunit C-like [Patella vulgata]